MNLLPKNIEDLLIENFNQQERGNGEGDGLYPLVKYFGGSACIWLVSEYDAANELFFGLADLGLGFPELGWFSKIEIFKLKFPPFSLPLERDLYFTAEKTISEYAKEAHQLRRINA